MNKMPLSSVRGRIRRFLEQHAAKLGLNVLEIGSRLHTPEATWLNNRDLCAPEGHWHGVDMQPGLNVDAVVDVCAAFPPMEYGGAFTGIVCSEVLEHVKDPLQAIRNCRYMLEPGGYLLVTTLTCFPIHGFPDDYWRFTPSGLGLLLDRAGFITVEVTSAGSVDILLNDHGEPRMTRRDCPMHVFAVAQKGLV